MDEARSQAAKESKPSDVRVILPRIRILYSSEEDLSIPSTIDSDEDSVSKEIPSEQSNVLHTERSKRALKRQSKKDKRIETAAKRKK